MLGFAYTIPERLQGPGFPKRTYESVRRTRPNVIAHLKRVAGTCPGGKHTNLLYIAINKVNNKIYVGVTKQQFEIRRDDHFREARRGGGGLFHKAIRKYGEEAFEFIIYARVWDYKRLLFLEKEMIAAIMPEYNMTSGGEGACNRILSEEHKQKIKNALKGRTSHLKGKKRGSAAALKMVATRRLGDNFQHGHRGKAVQCITDGKIFKSIKDASIYYSMCPAHMSEHLRGNLPGLTIKGLAFEFMKK